MSSQGALTLAKYSAVGYPSSSSSLPAMSSPVTRALQWLKFILLTPLSYLSDFSPPPGKRTGKTDEMLQLLTVMYANIEDR